MNGVDPFSGEMSEANLASFERSARNLIHNCMKMEFSDETHGKMYVAHGMNVEGTIVGMWASRGQSETDYEFKPGTAPRMVAKTLQYLGDKFIKDLVDRDMIDA